MSKTYLPNELINSNWGYELNEYYFTIHTNENCYQNYNTWYCDCIRVYHDLDYQYSNRFICSNNYSVSIPYSNLTSDFWYRKDISNSLIIFLVLFLFGIYLPYRIISRIFGRWLKV